MALDGLGFGIGLGAKVQPPNFAGAVERAGVLGQQNAQRKQERREKDYDKFTKDLKIDPNRYHNYYRKEAEQLTNNFLKEAQNLRNSDENTWQNQIPEKFIQLQQQLGRLEVNSKNAFDYEKLDEKSHLKDREVMNILGRGSSLNKDLSKYRNPFGIAHTDENDNFVFNRAEKRNLPDVYERILYDKNNQYYTEDTGKTAKYGDKTRYFTQIPQQLKIDKLLQASQDPDNMANFLNSEGKNLITKYPNVDFFNPTQETAKILTDEFVNHGLNYGKGRYDFVEDQPNKGTNVNVNLGGTNNEHGAIINDNAVGLETGRDVMLKNLEQGKTNTLQDLYSQTYNVKGTVIPKGQRNGDKLQVPLPGSLAGTKVELVDLKDKAIYSPLYDKGTTAQKEEIKNYLKGKQSQIAGLYQFLGEESDGYIPNPLSQGELNDKEKLRRAKSFGEVESFVRIPYKDGKIITDEQLKLKDVNGELKYVPDHYEDVYIQEYTPSDSPDFIGLLTAGTKLSGADNTRNKVIKGGVTTKPNQNQGTFTNPYKL